MTKPQADTRSSERRAKDAQIAAEPQMAAPELPHDAAFLPMEGYLERHVGRPLAVEGVVENGLVSHLDPAIKLAERSPVIIVANGEF